jgi:hypothetical protein
MTVDDSTIVGQTWKIPPAFHAGHTLTVRGRDAVDKHKAFWIDCDCGASFLMGEAHIERAVREQWSPYADADARSRPRPVKALRVKR